MKLRLPDGAPIELGSRYTHVLHRAGPAGGELVAAQGRQSPG